MYVKNVPLQCILIFYKFKEKFENKFKDKSKRNLEARLSSFPNNDHNLSS